MQRGVLGPRGIVNLEERKLVRDSVCLREYVCDGHSERAKLPRRVP
jgi:hypothetical protein